jgi:hypothetical protein
MILKRLCFWDRKKFTDDDIVCSLSISLTKDSHVFFVLNDENDENLEPITTLLYVICSDMFGDCLTKTVKDKYKNTEIVQQIFNNIAVLVSQEEDDDDSPIVDPCNVFSQNKEELSFEEQ